MEPLLRNRGEPCGTLATPYERNWRETFESGTLTVTYKADAGGRDKPQEIKIFQRGNRRPAVLKVKATVVDL